MCGLRCDESHPIEICAINCIALDRRDTNDKTVAFVDVTRVDWSSSLPETISEGDLNLCSWGATEIFTKLEHITEALHPLRSVNHEHRDKLKDLIISNVLSTTFVGPQR